VLDFVTTFPIMDCAMTKTSNKNARELTQARKPFKGSHTFAEWQGTMYAVYSYGYHFPLFVFDSIGKKWFENADGYSRSTARHRSQLRPTTETEKVPTAALQRLAKG